MRDVQLTVTRIPGFTMDLWGWTVRATQAPSGRLQQQTWSAVNGNIGTELVRFLNGALAC